MSKYPPSDFRNLIYRWMNTLPTDSFSENAESGLITSPEKDLERSLIKSIHREPFPELLKYWCEHHREDYLKETARGKSLYSIYTQGISSAVSRERYPCFLIDLIRDYPEFYSAVLNGLMVMWRRLRFSIVTPNHTSSAKDCLDDQDYELCIDSIRGQDIFLSDQDKNNISEIIADNQSEETRIHILVKDINRQTRVTLSEKARGINQRISWLQKAVYQNEVETIRLTSLKQEPLF